MPPICSSSYSELYHFPTLIATKFQKPSLNGFRFCGFSLQTAQKICRLKGKFRDKMGFFWLFLLNGCFLFGIFGLPSGDGSGEDFHSVDFLWKSVRRRPRFAGLFCQEPAPYEGGAHLRRVLEISFPHFFHILWGSRERCRVIDGQGVRQNLEEYP